MIDFTTIDVFALEFHKPIVYGNALLRKVKTVEERKVALEIPNATILDKILIACPSKAIVRQLLKLEAHVKESFGMSKINNLIPMVVVAHDMHIKCNLHLHKVDAFPTNENGTINMTLVGVKISRDSANFVWKVNSFVPQVGCQVVDDDDEEEEFDEIQIDDDCLSEIRESMANACADEIMLVRHKVDIGHAILDRLAKVLEILNLSPISAGNLEKAHALMDESPNII